ncbi:MAG TPA: protein-methionine-sulfoxide reductase catalytic subunit MsrP [Steroidobacteraceae bacterium]|jgi:sulfoxide reductase catalytic subunit YedY|nr:protein-methionine-sulfoxide reductase catalytic subunit MsrP [Steroidobacteraceae bacterium]
MHIRRSRPEDSARILPSEITPQAIFLNRRELLQSAFAAGLITAAGVLPSPAQALEKLNYTSNGKFSSNEKPNSFQDISTYNNFYEFGTDKSDPAAMSSSFKPTPWSVKISGEAEVKGTFTLEDILKPHPLEERIYRFRCVEAWSMVIPWVGFPLKDLIARFKPTSKAKYVAFKTVVRPSEMPGQRSRVLDWPYVEGLRMDEAMHPLAFMAVGLYGQTLPNQNGAPIRLVTPWKYGFKNIKSIVEISFVEREPPSTWNIAAPSEYGFYSNVNPNKDHPRWSQARERRIGSGTGLFNARQPTLMFNGYEEQVASMYKGMDLQKYF